MHAEYSYSTRQHLRKNVPIPSSRINVSQGEWRRQESRHIEHFESFGLQYLDGRLGLFWRLYSDLEP